MMIHPHNKKSGQRQEGQQISPVCGAKIRDRQQAPAEDGIYDPDADSHDHCKDSIFQMQDPMFFLDSFFCHSNSFQSPRFEKSIKKSW